MQVFLKLLHILTINFVVNYTIEFICIILKYIKYNLLKIYFCNGSLKPSV